MQSHLSLSLSLVSAQCACGRAGLQDSKRFFAVCLAGDLEGHLPERLGLADPNNQGVREFADKFAASAASPA